MPHESTNSTLRLKYIGHATLLIEMDGLRFLTDPVLTRYVGPLRRKGIDPALADYAELDAVLISHIHMDHLHLPSLRLLDRKTPLLIPDGAYSLVRELGFEHVLEMVAGETIKIKSADIIATPARHCGTRYPFGPIAECLGFVIRGSCNIYFAGDTGTFEDMANVESNLDVALLPIDGWGPRLTSEHLTPLRAAQALQILRPRFAIPIHWGTFFIPPIQWMTSKFRENPPYAFARHAAHLAPDVEIRILHPGKSGNISPLGHQ